MSASNAAVERLVECGRCGRRIDPEKAECCWLCYAPLCFDCWSQVGHCGHTFADDVNQGLSSLASRRRILP